MESLAIIYEKFKTAFLWLCNSLLGCVLQKYVLKCIEIFITALITVTPNWKENNYPSTIEYTNWCIYTIKYYTTIKLNELLLHATGVTLPGVTLSRRRQHVERTFMIPFIWSSKTGKWLFCDRHQNNGYLCGNTVEPSGVFKILCLDLGVFSLSVFIWLEIPMLALHLF